LELELEDCRRDPRGPWEGRSPRGLTKAFRKFSLAAPPPWGLRVEKIACMDDRAAQLELFKLGRSFK